MQKMAVVALFAFVGCLSDPNDPKTWIKKLDDPREQKDAVRMLKKLHEQKIGNNEAVGPLIELYRKTKDPEHLKALAIFSDPQSVPVLIESLDYSEESFDTASIAASALGEIGDKSAVDALVKAVQKPLPIKTRANVVKLESMKALAHMQDPRAIDALVKVLSTPADEQDFFLNQQAAKSLGAFADSKAVPALVRGLFMIGRGANIYQECRSALLAIGEPAVDKLIESMQRKNAELEADAKKYEFIPGMIVQKTSDILGDLRSRRAVDALIAQLDKKDEGEAAGEGKGVSEHQTVLTALGKIGDPKALKTLMAIAADKKRTQKERVGACDGLNMLGDPAGLPALLSAANAQFIDRNNIIDPAAALIAASGAVNYGRLAVADTNPDVLQKIKDKDPNSDEDWFADIRIQFQAAKDRIAVAKECKGDAACFEKYLSDKDSNKAEKAAFMLSRIGKAGLAPLCRHVDSGDEQARVTILFGISRLGDKTATECRAALEKQIAADEGKPQPYRHLVQEMRAVKAMISH